MADNKKVVLAYSGGLDTSVILKWLIEQGYDVIAYVADVGQNDDFAWVQENAIRIGASRVHVLDLKEEFLTDYIFPMFQANAVYEGRYLLGTAIARPLIARKQIDVARDEGAAFVAHGATGKGNDQVRFELAYHALAPDLKILSPWKTRTFLNTFKGRSDMIAYASQHGIPVKSSLKKPYSEDDNLLHISHEAGILEDPASEPPEDVYCRTVSPENAPDDAVRILIHFIDGVPDRVVNLEDETIKESPLAIFNYLNELGGMHGIGRVDMVENRFVGVKSRGVYETPGGTILYAAHRDIEGIAMDREVLRLRNQLSPKVAELIYNGFWFSPEMDFLMAAIRKSQELVNGSVMLKLYKGSLQVLGRESPSSLYDQGLSSMDAEGGYDQEDAAGFIRINAIRLKAHHHIQMRYVGA
jgi:argininosuccinate synthase